MIKNIVLGMRRSGKTTKAIKYLVDNPKSVMVTCTLREAERLHGLYPELKERIITSGLDQFGLGLVRLQTVL